MTLDKRSEELEIMDDFNISGPVVSQTLRELDVINRVLGGNAISINAFKNLHHEHPISSLADLGCGGADILKQMHKHAPKTNFIGFDANPHIINYAQENTIAHENIQVVCENIFSPEFKQRSFDVIHCCLFLHHFTKQQLIDLFKQFSQQAKRAIIFNDLHRHFLAYHSIKWITYFFSRSYMVRNDAAISVARGFKKSEIIELLNESGITNYTIQWKWAFRWKLIINCGE